MGSQFKLLVKAGGGYLGWDKPQSLITIPNCVVTSLLHRVAPGGVVLRTPTRDDITDAQFRFLMRRTLNLSVDSSYDSRLDPGVKHHDMMFGVCGSDVFIREAKSVGYVCGVSVGSAVLWDDGTFSHVSANGHYVPELLPPWDGSHGMFR